MQKWRGGLAFALLMAGTGLAAKEAPLPPPAPNPADYAVPVEALTIGKAKGRITERPFIVGGYYFASDTYTATRDNSFLELLGSRPLRRTVVVKFRFGRADEMPKGTPISFGRCAMTAKMWSGLFNSADNSLYMCKVDKNSALDFSMQAIIPDMEADSSSMLSISRDNPEKWKMLKVRLDYRGVQYEAIPHGFDLKREPRKLRVANGYIITRGGQPVGRIDFPTYKGSWSDSNGSYDRTSIITAPVAETDGREAVIFFAAHLLALPEANSPHLEEI